MKIDEKKLNIIEWIVCALLIIICFNYSILSYGSFSAIKAHERSERAYHYGPSEIVKTIDLKGGKLYLCKYKDWFSVSSVKKGVINWYSGEQRYGSKIDYSKELSYKCGISGFKDDVNIGNVYGYVNDPNITTIVAEIDDGRTPLRYDIDKSKMFIFYWNKDVEKYKIKVLKGLNKDGKVVYEERIDTW